MDSFLSGLIFLQRKDAIMSSKKYFRQFAGCSLKQDIAAGIIVALVSIPISIGYAQIAGLPPVYGLYGSLLPILVYSLITTSPRFVFGVDAAPAALAGSTLAGLGIASQSEEAMQIVPVLTLFAAIWLLIFRIIGMGKFVKFISAPVMGGFITGICTSIIVMQIPKLFGGSAGQGELPELIVHLIGEIKSGVHVLSLVLGLVTIAVIMICRKIIPKIPMSVIMMGVGALLTVVFHVDRYGVALLPSVPSGLPHFTLPALSAASGHVRTLIASSLSIALVILAETLLSTNDTALKNGDKIDNNREILAYACGNLAAAFTGCCPVNGSVSRTGIANQFGVRSQVMSVTAAAFMVLILLFGTGFISLLPVPVLTAIVISALLGSLEFSLAARLRRYDKVEFWIFYGVFFTVLIFGSIYGVAVGIVLSFVTGIIRASDPPRARLGYLPERNTFYPTDRMSGTRELEHVLIYRFSGSLFFANIGLLQDEIDANLPQDCKAVIIDASGITSIDVTAAERLLIMYDGYKEKGIRLFLTGHPGVLNDQLRAFGDERLFTEGAIRRTIEQALLSCGIHKPYPLRECETDACRIAAQNPVRSAEIAEFEWAFGDEAEEKMQEAADRLARQLAKGVPISDKTIHDTEKNLFGAEWTGVDEEKFLDALEMRLADLVKSGKVNAAFTEKLLQRISAYHAESVARAAKDGGTSLSDIIHIRISHEEKFRQHYPELVRFLHMEKEEQRRFMEEHYPQLLDKIRKIRAQEDGSSADSEDGGSPQDKGGK